MPRTTKNTPAKRTMTPKNAGVLVDEAVILQALEDLSARDSDIARVVAQAGPPPLRDRPPGLRTLVHIVSAQQVSSAAAKSISVRLDEALGPYDTGHVLKHDIDGLRACGLSRQKAT